MLKCSLCEIITLYPSERIYATGIPLGEGAFLNTNYYFGNSSCFFYVVNKGFSHFYFTLSYPILQNSKNPFDNEINVTFSLETAADVTLKVSTADARVLYQSEQKNLQLGAHFFSVPLLYLRENTS